MPIQIIGATKNSADLRVGAATIKIGKVAGKLQVISKFPQECRVPKKLMYEAYVAAAEAMTKAQQ